MITVRHRKRRPMGYGWLLYVLMVHVEELISTHSMGNVGSYHTKFKDHCKAGSTVSLSDSYLVLQRVLTKLVGQVQCPTAHELGHHHSL